MQIIYLAGKYSDSTPEGVDANIRLAESYAIDLWNAGFGVICPHLNTSRFERLTKVSEEKYLEFYLKVVERCDAVFAMFNWNQSTGTIAEIGKATSLGIPVFYDLQDLISTLGEK